MRTLLCDRQPSLGISVDFDPGTPPQGDLLRFSGRDSGCYRKAVDLLRQPQRTHRHALLCFDRHGCGAEAKSRTEIEGEIEAHLRKSGWREGHAAVIVLDPELEMWVWADSPHVADSLGWAGDRNSLKPYLIQKGFWKEGDAKPHDPKQAFTQALREKSQPAVAPVFAQIASNVSMKGCQDPAFGKLCETLQRWFPQGSA